MHTHTRTLLPLLPFLSPSVSSLHAACTMLGRRARVLAASVNYGNADPDELTRSAPQLAQMLADVIHRCGKPVGFTI